MLLSSTSLLDISFKGYTFIKTHHTVCLKPLYVIYLSSFEKQNKTWGVKTRKKKSSHTGVLWIVSVYRLLEGKWVVWWKEHQAGTRSFLLVSVPSLLRYYMTLWDSRVSLGLRVLICRINELHWMTSQFPSHSEIPLLNILSGKSHYFRSI